MELGPGLARAGRPAEDLADSGFIVLGGPLQGEREVLFIVSAPDEDTVGSASQTIPGYETGCSRSPRTILLDGLRGSLPNPTDDLPAT
jgi:hypothetical protein